MADVYFDPSHNPVPHRRRFKRTPAERVNSEGFRGFKSPSPPTSPYLRGHSLQDVIMTIAFRIDGKNRYSQTKISRLMFRSRARDRDLRPSWSRSTRSISLSVNRGANYRKKPQCDPPVGCVVQVEVAGTSGPLSVVVQVVLDDGGVLLEMSIHPQQANAATSISARRMFFRLIRIVHSF